MTRPRSEIMRDLHAILAELNYAMEMEDKDIIAGVGTGDLSPKLAQALNVPRETRTTMPTTAEQPIESHEDIRAKARAYRDPGITTGQDRPEPGLRPRDSYRESYDPGFDEAVFLGSGDRRED